MQIRNRTAQNLFYNSSIAPSTAFHFSPLEATRRDHKTHMQQRISAALRRFSSFSRGRQQTATINKQRKLFLFSFGDEEEKVGKESYTKQRSRGGVFVRCRYLLLACLPVYSFPTAAAKDLQLWCSATLYFYS